MKMKEEYDEAFGINSTFIAKSFEENWKLLDISNDDFEFINSIPGISARIASQMLLDLKDYITKSNRENFSRFKDIKSILKSFKFKSKEIDDVLLNIYIPNATDQDILKEALKRLGYGKNFG
mgnify:CR=1 FL=1